MLQGLGRLPWDGCWYDMCVLDRHGRIVHFVRHTGSTHKVAGVLLGGGRGSGRVKRSRVGGGKLASSIYPMIS